MHADEDREHQQQPDRGDEHRPAEERHPTEAHARRPSRQDRRGQRQRDGGEADDEQHEGGEEEVDHLGVAAAGTAVGGERHDHDHQPAEPRPEARPRRASGRPANGRRPAAGRSPGRCRAAAGRARRTRARCGTRRTSGAARRRRRASRTRDTRSSPSSTPTTAVAARASSEQPIILTPVTLESADVSHAAVAATTPVPAPRRPLPGADVAMESGLRSVVLIRGAGGGGARRRRSSDAGRTLPVRPRASRNRPGRATPSRRCTRTSTVRARNSTVTYVML